MVGVPLPKGRAGPWAPFPLHPRVGYLLWKAEVFGLLVYSEVPQTSSSISEPVTSDYLKSPPLQEG